MPAVTVKYIDRTCLEQDPYIKLVKEYSKELQYDVSIIFDKRIVSMGTHFFDSKKKTHIIRLSPDRNKFHLRDIFAENGLVRLGPTAEKYNLLATTLHELKHAQQKEELGRSYYNNDFSTVNEITNPDIADWYSKCECEARIHENKHIRDAVEFYNSSCK